MLERLEPHLPRKGWYEIAKVDSGQRTVRCEGCGHSMRYCRHLAHDLIPNRVITVGISCAEILTGKKQDTGKTEKEGEREMPETQMQKKRRIFMGSFKPVKEQDEKYKWEYGELQNHLKCVVRLCWDKKKEKYKWVFWCGKWDTPVDVSDMRNTEQRSYPWSDKDQDGTELRSNMHAKQAAWDFAVRNFSVFGFDYEEVKDEPGIAEIVKKRQEERQMAKAQENGKGTSGSASGVKAKEDSSSKAGLPLSKPEAMKAFAKMFPELGISPEEAFMLGFYLPMSATEEGMSTLHATMPAYWKAITDYLKGDYTDVRSRILKYFSQS